MKINERMQDFYLIFDFLDFFSFPYIIDSADN